MKIRFAILLAVLFFLSSCALEPPLEEESSPSTAGKVDSGLGAPPQPQSGDIMADQGPVGGEPPPEEDGGPGVVPEPAPPPPPPPPPPPARPAITEGHVKRIEITLKREEIAAGERENEIPLKLEMFKNPPGNDIFDNPFGTHILETKFPAGPRRTFTTSAGFNENMAKRIEDFDFIRLRNAARNANDEITLRGIEIKFFNFAEEDISHYKLESRDLKVTIFPNTYIIIPRNQGLKEALFSKRVLRDNRPLSLLFRFQVKSGPATRESGMLVRPGPVVGCDPVWTEMEGDGTDGVVSVEFHGKTIPGRRARVTTWDIPGSDGPFDGSDPIFSAAEVEEIPLCIRGERNDAENSGATRRITGIECHANGDNYYEPNGERVEYGSLMLSRIQFGQHHNACLANRVQRRNEFLCVEKDTWKVESVAFQVWIQQIQKFMTTAYITINDRLDPCKAGGDMRILLTHYIVGY